MAEGPGRPVLHHGHRDAAASDGRPTAPHVDTARQPTTRWRLEDPGAALADRQAMIRATLAAEAKMEAGQPGAIDVAGCRRPQTAGTGDRLPRLPHDLETHTVTDDLEGTGCPICGRTLKGKKLDPGRDVWCLDCTNCGTHQFSAEALRDHRWKLSDDATAARVAHAVHRCRPDQPISASALSGMIDRATLPDALQRLDLLVTHLATELPPGSVMQVSPFDQQALLGCETTTAVGWVFRQAMEAGWLAGNPNADVTLTAKGWHRFAERQRNGTGSRHAFMAMAFREADIGALFAQHLVPAVRRTGFTLRTTDHGQKTAGLIDSRMRVELRTSRFVVCDLTHGNRGAYWEAGFAEGIGRPVFDLCRQDVHASPNPDIKPHFDIAHQAIVKWDPKDPGPAMDELVAMIRATLPAEATMED